MIEYAWSHGIISDKLYHSIVNDCQFAPEANSESVNQTATGHCDDHLIAFLLAYSDIDIYSIYAPICLSPSSSSTFSSFVGGAPRIFSKHVSSSRLWPCFDISELVLFDYMMHVLVCNYFVFRFELFCSRVSEISFGPTRTVVIEFPTQLSVF